MLTGQMRVNTRYTTTLPSRMPIVRSRASVRSKPGPAPWITHRKNANATWKPAYAMRGDPNATHADSHAPTKTSAISSPIDDSDGTTNTSAAVPISAPTMQPAMRSVSFSTVSAVEPSDTM